MQPLYCVRLLFALALASVGCLGRGAASREARGSTGGVHHVAAVMSVDNRNWQDVVIYAVHDGTHTRLGTVTAASRASFYLQSSIVRPGNELQFVAHAVGERRMFASERVVVLPGQRVEWTLESGLERSSLVVR